MSEPVAVVAAATSVEHSAPRVPALRREAILPSERRGGLGAVALLCSLAGVASGFALATTILATQLANSEAGMTYRHAGHHARPHAILGVLAPPSGDGSARVEQVFPNTPAQQIGLRVGDRIVRFDGERIDRPYELTTLVGRAPIGYEPRLEVVRDDTTMVLYPTLVRGRSDNGVVRPTPAPFTPPP